jgi:hypothetical protein
MNRERRRKESQEPCAARYPADIRFAGAAYLTTCTNPGSPSGDYRFMVTMGFNEPGNARASSQFVEAR